MPDRKTVRVESKTKSPAIDPAYYRRGGIEVIDFIEAYNLTFCRATAVKYLARAGEKDPAKTIEDLEKAAWYVQREINRLRREQADRQWTASQAP